MPGYIVHKDALVACKHVPGLAHADAPDARVKVSGMPVVTVLSSYTVIGCALNSGSSPPCSTAMWMKGAEHVFAGGLPVAIDSGTSLCLPSGASLDPKTVQQRVKAS